MDERITALLAKYLAGETSSREKKEAEAWILQSKENEEAFIEFCEAWHAALLASETRMVDADAAFEKVLATQLDYSAFNRRKKIVQIMVSIAASLTILVFLTLWLIEKNKNHPADSVAVLQEVAVPANSKKKLILPDSTLIWLNEATTLKWDKEFNHTNRTVYLEGEAYFEIAASKKQLPFIVRTSQFTIRDIGTSFNIKSHSADSLFEAVVLEGIVSVKGNISADNKITELRLLKDDVLKVRNGKINIAEPSKQAVANKPTVIISKIMQPDIYIGWKDDMLVFDDESFSAVVKKLEDRFKVNIAFDEVSLAAFRYSGSFNQTADLENVLDVIKETTPIVYEKNEDGISIKYKK